MKKMEIEDYITKDIRESIIEWRGRGKTHRWIAKEIGISLSLLNKWKDEYPWFKEIFKKGKQELRDNLESAIYNRALGYKITETEYGETDGIPMTRTREKFIQSDVALKNALSHVDRKGWSKEVLDTTGESDNKGSDKIVFGGESDL